MNYPHADLICGPTTGGLGEVRIILGLIAGQFSRDVAFVVNTMRRLAGSEGSRTNYIKVEVISVAIDGDANGAQTQRLLLSPV